MSTENSPLIHKLIHDFEDAQEELDQAEERVRLAKWKLQYIKTLLESAPPTTNNNGASVGEFAGMTIAEIAVAILKEKGEPMSAMDIARRAMAGGFDADNIERARSHFSAVISKDINSAKSRFRQIGRGSIGLTEWPFQTLAEAMRHQQGLENTPTATSNPSAKIERNRLPQSPPQPFGEEELKEEDMPF